LDPELEARVRVAREKIAAALVPPFIALAAHPSPELRSVALAFLANRDEPDGKQLVLDALTDSDEQVQRLAIAAAKDNPHLSTVRPLTRLLSNAHQWPLRILAAEALQNYASLSGFAASPESELAQAALVALCNDDPYALVREASARALFALYGRASVPILSRVATEDPEDRVRQTARNLLGTW
jgi:cellulose synthase operon protein C